jgi:hypothetical protein
MSNSIADVKALVAFGRLGVMLLGARILSVGMMFGLLFLAWWIASTAIPSWHAVVVTCVVALCFIAAVRAETGHRQTAEGSPNAP